MRYMLEVRATTVIGEMGNEIAYTDVKESRPGAGDVFELKAEVEAMFREAFDHEPESLTVMVHPRWEPESEPVSVKVVP